MEDAGRKYRRAARKIAAEYAGKAITHELWESRLKGDADEQASIAVQFLDMARTALSGALSEMRVRR